MRGVGEPRWCNVCELIAMGRYLSDEDGQHLVCSKGHYLRIGETAEQTLERLRASHVKYRGIALQATATRQEPQSDEETEEAIEEPISAAELRQVRKERLEKWSREAIDTTPDRFENDDYQAATAELLLAIAANLELLRMGLEDGSYLSPC